jgi:hypothetical protein
MSAQTSYHDRRPHVVFGGVRRSATARWRIWHLQRGGGHAILGWVRRGLDAQGRSSVHLNHCLPGEALADPIPESADVQIWTLEDRRYDGRRADVDLFVLRDFVNLAASRWRAGTRHRADDHTELCWIEAMNLRHSMHVLDFNRWFVDGSYRAESLARLGLEPDPSPWEHVVEIGRGSSFDGTMHDGNAQAMGVLDRWRSLAGDPSFCSALARHRVALRLSLEWFGDRMGNDWVRFVYGLLRG